MNDLYTQRRGLLKERTDPEELHKIIKNRKAKVIHVLMIARSELNRRGWDKTNNDMRNSDACSMLAIVDFACINRLGTSDDFIVQRDIVYCVLNKVVESMSRKKYNDFRTWEQKQRSQVVIQKALDQAFLACTRSL